MSSGLLSRTKGKVFERLVAADIRKALPAATVRRSIQSHKAWESDVVIEGDVPAVVKRIWLEATNSRKPNISEKLAQSESDAAKAGPDRLPILVWRRTGSRVCYVSARLCVLGKIMGFATESQAIATIHWPELLAVFGRLAAGKYVVDGIQEAIRECRIQVRTGRDAPRQPPPRSQHSIAAARQEIPKLEIIPAPDGYPSVIPMAGQEWSVRYATDLCSSHGLLGVTYSNHRQIIMDATMAPDALGETLTHEFLHACFSTSGLQIDEEVEERIIRAVSPFVFSALKSGSRWW